MADEALTDFHDGAMGTMKQGLSQSIGNYVNYCQWIEPRRNKKVEEQHLPNS